MDTAVTQLEKVNDYNDTQRGSVVELRGRDVKDLITKFFYKENHLCFHVFLQLHAGEIVFFMEFTDYARYKEVFSELQLQKSSDNYIGIQKKNTAPGRNEPILA